MTRAPLLIVALMFAGVIASVVVVNGRPGADPSGKDAMIPALAVVVVGVLLILIVQSRARRSARTADLDAAQARAASERRDLADAGAASPDEVQASLAITPDAARDVQARRAMWGVADRSARGATIAALLVVVLMPAAIITQNPQIIVLAAVPIVLFALYSAAQTIRPGGRLDQAYASADEIMRPLGLEGIQRPQWVVIPYATGDLHSTVIGPTVLGGRRHGRDVEVTLQGGRSQVAVGCEVQPFTLEGKGGVLKPGDDAPPRVRGAVGTLAPADVWNGAKVEAGDGRILVSRRRSGQERWAHDLWLAERLANAAGTQ